MLEDYVVRVLTPIIPEAAEDFAFGWQLGTSCCPRVSSLTGTGPSN
jgi:hypothetical protein